MIAMKKEIKEYSFVTIVSIGIPLLVFQLTDTIILFVDRFIVSLLGNVYLSASLTGGLSYVTYTSLFIGCLNIINTFVSQQYGAKKNDICCIFTFAGIVIAIVFSLLLLAGIPLAKGFFFGKHAVELKNAEGTYFTILVFSAFFSLVQTCYVGFFIGTNRIKTVMISNIIGMLLNIPLSYGLVFGFWIIPAFGIAGAAWGTFISKFFIVLLLTLVYFGRGNNSNYASRRNIIFSFPEIKKILSYGIPSGMEQFVNIFCINLFVQFLATYNIETSTAVSVAFNWDLLSYLPLLGLGGAATTIVARQIGQQKIKNIHTSVFRVMIVALLFSSVSAFCYLFFTKTLVGVFVHEPDSSVFALAVIFLRFAAVYTLADSIQVVFSASLRGTGDTRWVMIASALLHALLAILTFIGTRYLYLDAIILWYIYIGFVVVLAITMIGRFFRGKWKSYGVL